MTTATETEADIKLPPKLVPLFTKPRGAYQYRGSYGGRGSGKSFNFAKMAAVWGYAEPLRILCTREFQASIKESFHAELKAAIASEPWLEAHYDVGVDYLRGRNGTEFIFRGLRHQTGSIKSLAKIDLTIVEEAEDVPEASWLALEATVFRQPKSELWPIWNPRLEGSPVDNRFRKNCPSSARMVEMNWQDNNFFPAGLQALRKREQERLDPNTYAHVWEGAYLVNSDAQVFAGKWRVEEFEPGNGWDGPYQGGDFGYSVDPTAAVQCYVSGDTLYVRHEAFGKPELDAIPSFVCDRIPGFERHTTRWDSSAPGSISLIKRNGLPRSEGVEKWSGSVEDGIRFLRSFRDIVVHPDCRGLINELRLYSYKVDRLTGDVLPVVADAHNHGCIAEGELVETKRGSIPIERVAVGDEVLTRRGYRRVLAAGMTGRQMPVIRILTTAGAVTCTPDHRIWVEGKGFIRADAVRYSDIVNGVETWRDLKRQFGAARRGGDGPTRLSTPIGATFSAALRAAWNTFIAPSGKRQMGQSRAAFMSTTSTATPATMIWGTSNASVLPSIPTGMNGMMSGALRKLCSWIAFALSPKHGTPARRGGRSIARSALWPIRSSPPRRKTAVTAASPSCLASWAAWTSSAPTGAKVHGGGMLGWMMKRGSALNAEPPSPSIGTSRPAVVRGRVLSVFDTGAADVYDLTIEGEHEFFAGGILVHNCDALRYAVTPMIKRRGRVARMAVYS